MDLREFPLLPVHNLNDDDTIEEMQLEIGAGGDVQSENNLDQTIEQVIADGIKLSQELALSIDSISPTAIVSSPGPLSSVPSLDPPAPLPDSSARSPAGVDASSSDVSGSDCTLPDPGYQARRKRTDSPRPPPIKMFRVARRQKKTKTKKTSFI